MLEFFEANQTTGIATIYDRHILFNTKLIPFFENAYKVRVALDKEDKKIYVFMIDKDYALSGELSETSLLSISVSKSYVRIASKPLIEFISNTFNLKINKGESIGFKANYDNNKKCIIIDLGGEV